MKDIETQYDGIAIIGMAGRFPGAGSVEEFWANLVAGRETVSFFTDEELTESGLDPLELRRRGRYVAARGVLTDIDCFDAAFFGVHPKEAEVIDPQQRVFLETCWTALERAGYAPNRAPGSVGVFAGSTFNTFYLHALHQKPELIDLIGAEHVMFGNEKDYLTTRVAYKLGLKGPALNVATACSTSLVAVGQACQSLLTYQCDMALAGAVSITVPQKRGYYHDDGQIGSSDGHTRTFDVRSDGTVFSNGVGVVVLKRLDDAMADGDQIYAVIKGAALNNDGSERVSFGAPGVEGQSQVIAMAHALAGVDPATVTCVEAHGTATPLGDPIEVAGLTRAFRLGTTARQFCALGSVKTNVGHLDVAAGVAGLIKMSLALHHRVIPASLHFTEPNPKLELEKSPFYVNTTLREWQPPAGVPRRAGVSSFGTGGTNAHIVLEEAPRREPSSGSRPWQLLVLSAKTPDALDRASVNLSDHLRQFDVSDAGRASRELADAAFTLQTGRSEFVRRRVVVARDAAEGASLLETVDARRVFSHHQQLVDPPVVFMFPGQGAQYAGMGRELYRHEPLFRHEVDRCAVMLGPLLDCDLRALIFEDTSSAAGDSPLVQTRFTQPALFVIEYALARLLMSWGIKPAAMIGHSVGEYVAGCLAGVMTLDDALSLIARRGALVQAQPRGSMLAVRLPAADVLPLLDDRLSIAAINAPSLCVVSGPVDRVAELEAAFVSRGVGVRHLQTSHAFHSPMMAPVVAPFEELVTRIALSEPVIPYVSNVTGRWITAREAMSPAYWAEHVRDTVRFADGVAELLKDPRHVLLEVGPGQTLSTLARQHPARQAEQMVLASLPIPGADELRGTLETLGRLWMAGIAIDWSGFHMHETRRRVVLPTYPFERTRYWPDGLRATAPLPAPAGVARRESPAASSATATRAPEPAHVMANTAGPRRDRLVASARALLQELSGYDFSSVDASADLLELGLDSLLLTQAAQLFHKRFSVSITFRQLIEDLSSIDAIATFLDSRLPIEKTTQPPDAIRVTPPSAATHAKPEVRGHGPFRPMDRNASTALSATQRRVLDEVIASYTARTAGSKERAASERPVLADPRSVAGFNRLWKEMVYPIFSVRSDGSKIWDVDSHEYVDFVMGFSASLFGHRPPFVVEAVAAQLERGFEIGPIQPLAGEVARLVSELTGQPRVAFTNTGSEAVLAAMRLARTVTRRDKIAVFAGAYHGIFDEVLFRPAVVDGEAAAAPIAPGIPESALGQMIVLDYCDPQALEILRRRGAEIAGVLVEPVQARRLDLQPGEFLHQLRRVTQDTGSALIIDEIVTGFRVHPGGAQGYFGVRADLATYGKVMGGGVPIGVVAGDPKFIDALDGGAWQYGDASFPEVGVTFFAGTFVRHPLALAAAKATLTHLSESGPQLQEQLAARTARFAGELREIAARHRAPYEIRQFSSLMQITFPPDQKLGSLLFYLLRERGIHVWENRGVVMTTRHTDEDLERFAAAFDDSLVVMTRGEFFAPSSQRETQTADLPAAAGSAAAGDVFPLTEGQLEVWLASQMSRAGSCAFNEALALEMRGPIDPAALARALAQVVARHESLRMTVVTEPPGLRVSTTMSVPLVQQDLSGLTTAEREEAVAQVLLAGDGEAFDLEHGPLARFTLVKLGVDRHVLAVAAHHLICDGWSFGIVLRDLAAFYSAAVRGTALSLPAPLQASRFAVLDREEKKGLDAAAAEAFWIKQFETIPDPLELPADRPRPIVKSYRGQRVSVRFNGALAGNLKKLAARHRTTLFTALIGGFETLIYRLTGQDDFVIGVPVAWQPRLGGQDLVAHCLNFVPLRVRVRPEATFAGYLDAIRSQTLDISEYQNFTYGSLLAKLRLPHDPGRDPLVPVSFTLEPAIPDLQFEGATAHSIPVPRTTSKRDLHFNIIEVDDGLVLDIDYSSDLFDESTIRRWVASYRVLLEAAVANPDRRLSELPLMSAEEQRRVLGFGRPSDATFARNRTLSECFERQVHLTPNAPAVTFEGRHLTYDELNRRANRVAHHLIQLGVGPEVLVGLLTDRSPEQVVGLLAILKAGGAYVPIDPAYPAERVQFILEDAKARILITQSHVAPAMPAGTAAILCLDELEPRLLSGPAVDPPRRSTPDSLAYVIYTSGSTGKPKGALVTHDNVVRLFHATEDLFHFNEHDVWTLFHSHAFDFSVWELWGALFYGGRVVIVPYLTSRIAEDFYRLLADERVTVLNQTPSAFRHLLEADARLGENLPLALRYVIFGGEALQMSSLRPWFDRHGDARPQLVNMYGITETTVHVTHRVLSADDVAGGSVIGRPIQDLQIYLLDQHQQPVPIGVTGEIHVGGAGVARGYLNREDLTRQRFVPDPFSGAPGARLYRSGDRARFLANQDLEYVGRADQQIKIRGFRVELEEIESVLERVGGAKRCVVALRDTASAERQLVAYIEPSPDRAPVVADLRRHLKAELPDYMVPAVFVVVDHLPLTAHGKLDRAALPAPSDVDIAAGQVREFVAPSTPVEIALAEIWKQVLGVQAVGVHDDFFDLGGHSLLAARAAMQIRDRFQVDASLAMFFEAPTIAAMAASIDARRTSPAARVIPRVQRTPALKRN